MSFLLCKNDLQVKEDEMPYCTVCKIETDYKYGIALSGEMLCVEGFCELRQDIRVFALERMQGLEVIED